MPSLTARARNRLTKNINYFPLPFYIVVFNDHSYIFFQFYLTNTGRTGFSSYFHPV